METVCACNLGGKVKPKSSTYTCFSLRFLSLSHSCLGFRKQEANSVTDALSSGRDLRMQRSGKVEKVKTLLLLDSIATLFLRPVRDPVQLEIVSIFQKGSKRQQSKSRSICVLFFGGREANHGKGWPHERAVGRKGLLLGCGNYFYVRLNFEE